MGRKKKVREETTIEVKQPKANYFLWSIKNIAFACIAALLIRMVLYPFGEESTLIHNIYKDMNAISKLSFKKTSLDERYSVVLKTTYTYFNLIKNNSPEDAVILYPDYNAFFPENEEPVFNNPGIASKMWAIRFLYPRIIITPAELESSSYKDKITYVAIVNGRGREFLPYELDEGAKFGVVMLNPTEEELQIMNDKNRE